MELKDAIVDVRHLVSGRIRLTPSFMARPYDRFQRVLKDQQIYRRERWRSPTNLDVLSLLLGVH